MNEFYKIGFGTYGFGENEKNKQEDIKSIKDAINLGIKHIDTAENYADGKCETLVGEAIKDFKRQDLFIATKVRGQKLSYEDVLKSCAESLDRLKLDYIDLFYVHAPNPEIPIAETARAFNELYKKGFIRNIGICNAKIETMQEYQKHLLVPVFASQCHYNLIAREPQKTNLLEYCKNNNIHFVAWRPIQLPMPAMGIEPLYKKGVYRLLDEMSEKYKRTNAQIAIKWLIQQVNVNVVFKSSNNEHIKEILDTRNFDLTETDWKKLNENFPRQEDISFVSYGKKPLI